MSSWGQQTDPIEERTTSDLEIAILRTFRDVRHQTLKIEVERPDFKVLTYRVGSIIRIDIKGVLPLT